MQEKQVSNILQCIGLVISIIAILVTIYHFNIDNKRDIRVTDVQIYGLFDNSASEDGLPYESTWDFLDLLSDAFVQFHTENHSKFDIEIYGFYIEVQVANLSGNRILIPLESSIKGTDITVSSYLSDWEVTTEIDKCTLNALSTYEVYADIGKTIQGGVASWYLSSEWSEDDNPVLNKLISTLAKDNDLVFKIRVVCKDTFGNFYNSDWLKYTITQSQ